MKALVTGGAGFIGSNLVDRLISLEHDVVVLDNESSDAHEFFYWNDGACNYKVNICDYEKTVDAYKDVDFVFHIAAEARIQPAIENPLLAVQTNVLGTATVLQCARENNVKRVIYSSTSSAYGLANATPNTEDQPDDCLNPYSVSKVSGEKLCKMYSSLFGLETVILRYFNVYGYREPRRGNYAPVVGLFDRNRRNGEPLTVVGDGEQRRDFTNVSDVVEANILAASSTIPKEDLGMVLNIGSGVNYSINQVASMFGGKVVHAKERMGEARETLADCSKAKNLIGWEAKVKLPDYIRYLLECD